MIDNLQFELNGLLVNFNRVDETTRRAFRFFEPPSAAEMSSYSNDLAIQSKINEMLVGDAAMRLYAAVLLDRADKSRSAQIISELKNETAIIKVQKQIGHGVIEAPTGILAAGFEREGKIWSSSLRKIESLAGWELAIRHEERGGGESPVRQLPKLWDVFAAQSDAEKMSRLEGEIETLLAKSAAHKLYAAQLLAEIDEAKKRSVLESLKNDETPIIMVFGDIAEGVPASEVAAAILENRAVRLHEGDFSHLETPIDKFFNWIRKGFSGGKRK